MLYTALDLGISATEFWEEFTPRAVLLLAKARSKTERQNRPAKPGSAPQKGPLPKINRIPR